MSLDWLPRDNEMKDHALIGGEQVGQAVIEAIGDSPAVLLKNHGVFTVGPSGEEALKAAVMVYQCRFSVRFIIMSSTGLA